MMACKNCCFNPFQRSHLFCLLLLYGRPVGLLKVPKKGMKCKDVVISSFPETSLHVCQTGGIHWHPLESNGYFPSFTLLPRLDEWASQSDGLNVAKSDTQKAVFRDHKRGKKKRLHWPDGIWKKWDGSSFLSQRSSVDWRRWKWFNDPDSLSHAISRKKYQSVLIDLECVQRCQMPKSRCLVRNGNPKWGKMATLTHCKWEKMVPGDEDKNLLISTPRKYRGIWGWLFNSYHWIPSEHSKNTIDFPIECLTWNVLAVRDRHRETRRFKIIAGKCFKNPAV